VFNDDIQGTGAVVLSGFINAAKLASAASGRPLNSQRILFLGAGSAGVGVAMQLMSFFTINGLSAEEARNSIYLVDTQGLVFDTRGPLAKHKKSEAVFRHSFYFNPTRPFLPQVFSRHDYKGPALTNLLDIIAYVKPTALLGLSTTKVSTFRQSRFSVNLRRSRDSSAKGRIHS
jgi:malate dehydrogenase (oxaloacetate-decarboxylating)(NADP+)